MEICIKDPALCDTNDIFNIKKNVCFFFFFFFFSPLGAFGGREKIITEMFHYCTVALEILKFQN